ncbi:MAG: TolC family protein, partial [Kordiimonadaceae bacterium]|nr:TolC family protein [Kordiimonadaceae bacterium]
NEDEAIDKAPIIEFARAKVEFMRAEFKEANSSWSSSPKLSVGVKRERGSFLDRNIDSVGIGLSLPFGATSHTTSKRAEASMALAQAERELQLTKRDYRLELHEAEHDLEICEIQLPYMKSHFELSQENLRLSQKAFNMGESDLLDLIKIQEQYVLSSAQNNKKIIECKRAIARQNQVQGVMVQ